jgi:hypothetical protein
MQRMFWMTVVLVILGVGSAWADPFLGVWKMNTDGKSHGAITAQTITVTATADGHKWSYDTTLANGRHVQYALLTNVKAGTVTMQTADGKVLATGHFKKTGDAAWEVDAPKHKSTGSIGADGKKMTVVMTVPMQVTLVFDKVQ